MDIFAVFGIAAVTAAIALTLKQYRPELAMQVSAAGGVLVLLRAMTSISSVADMLTDLFEQSGVEPVWFALIIKIAGIAYITQISAELCRDAGESALACKTELCGRAMMLACVLPAITEVVNILIELTESMG